MNDFTDRNRLYNCGNPHQGAFKRVLCVCSAGLLRSPTTAVVLANEPFNYNTRACGLVPDYALIPFDKVLAAWANEIVCMTQEQETIIQAQLVDWGIVNTKVISLGIPDSFAYRDPKLMEMIKDSYVEKAQIVLKNNPVTLY